MTDGETPVRRQTTRLLMGGKARGYATLLLYPDKLAAVSSGVVRLTTPAGLVVAFILAIFIPPHTGPGALGALIGAGVGYLIGAAIANSRAAAKVATGGDDVTVIPLDSITSLEMRKSKVWLGGQHLVVTTADGAQYGFKVKLERWSADLAKALAARGREVRSTPQGMTVTPAPSA
jgi:hypothetical protein